jgi:hypothetical protein
VILRDCPRLDLDGVFEGSPEMSPAEQLIDEDALRLWRPPLVLEPSPPKLFYGPAVAATIGGQPVGNPLPVPVALAGVSSTGRRLLWNSQ